MSIEGGKLILRIIRAKWRDETSFIDDHDGVIALIDIYKLQAHRQDYLARTTHKDVHRSCKSSTEKA